MKIYLAARYSRRNEMREIASTLKKMGHIVTSRWIDSDWDSSENTASLEYRSKYSVIDMDDIRKADCVISFTEKSGTGGRGGRHVEYGMAVASNKILVVVGHYENIFHHLPGVIFYNNAAEMLSNIGR